MRHNKFHNKKVHAILFPNGTDRMYCSRAEAQKQCLALGLDKACAVEFDSTKEFKRWRALRALERAGEIDCLQRQVKFELIPASHEVRVIGHKTIRKYNVGNSTFTRRDLAERYARDTGLDVTPVEEQVEITRAFTIEKAAYYTADFTYKKGDEYIVEDVKSPMTRNQADYVLRRKLMLHVHGIKLLET